MQVARETKFRFCFVAHIAHLPKRFRIFSTPVHCAPITGRPLLGWRVSPLQLEDLSPIAFEDTAMPGGDAAAAGAQADAGSSSIPLRGGPAFYRY
jgi:hypothetical protein